MEQYVGKRKDAFYHAYAAGIFDGRDEDIRCRTESIVTTRKPHQCLSPLTMQLHDIPAGTRAWCERAIVDGVFGAYYACIKCLDDYFDDEELGLEPEDFR